MMYPIRCNYVHIKCLVLYPLTLPLKFPVIFAIEICRLVESCTSTMNMWREQKEGEGTAYAGRSDMHQPAATSAGAKNQ
jgi:hypothetical protein